MKYFSFVIVLGLLGSIGCGSGSTTPCNCPDSPCLVDTYDSQVQDTDFELNEQDNLILTDTESDTESDINQDIEIESGAFGSACESNKDCLSGYCIETPNGYTCTKTCVTDCPAGWDCRATMIGQDLVSICIPAGVTLCRPCKLDTQCGGGHCIKLENTGYCGMDCKDDNNCPKGYSCKDVEPVEDIGQATLKQCVPDTMSCNCNLLTQGKQRVCQRENEFGRCFGYETCDAVKGWVGCDAPEPMAELCNGLDDNCNGITDEFAVPPKYPCQKKVDGVGTCKGDWECKDSGWVCNARTPETEICDGVDNNCDGSIDEVWPNLGKPCYVGVGSCTTVGTYVCNTTLDDVECQGTPGEPKEETCNYIDDNCNGSTDETFKDNGVYDKDTACGNCFTDCTTIWSSATDHANGHCSVTSGTPSCNFSCVSGYADADGNPENGCEMLIDQTAIYVSTPDNGGLDDSNCGAWDSPCASITYGGTRAQSMGRSKVLVSAGIYAEQVTLINGISVMGGYNAATWALNPDSNITIIQGTSPATSKHKKAVIAQNITSATIFSGFTIYGENNFYQATNESGGNSYAIYVLNSTGVLTIRDNLVYAGRGGKGADGVKGADGANGGAGGKGADGADHYHTCSGTQAGGSAGVASCGVSGGAGASSHCPNNNDQEPSGSNGHGSGHGNGGAGGYDSYILSSNCNQANVNGNYYQAGRDGTDGKVGNDGNAGTGCSGTDGHVSGQDWTPYTGASGKNGSAGSGGGGGGAGAGVQVDSYCNYMDTLGGAGGGGGAGGCLGKGGSAGYGGGASIGIIVLWTKSGSPASLPVITNNTIIRNLGGQGGNGGNGGIGGQGGKGGPGGIAGGTYEWAVGKGGHGGNGGNGGNGGGGGGGCGGSSYGVYSSGLGSGTNTYCSGNSFDHLGGGGTGGAGGSSNGHPGTKGAEGAASDCTAL